jgi:hypothetical protein
MVDLIPINRRKMNTNQPTNQPELVRLGDMQGQALAYTVIGKRQMSRWFNVLPTPSRRHLDAYLADWRTFNLDILEEAKEVGASS